MFEFIYRKPIRFIYRRLIKFIKMRQQKQINYYDWLVAHNNDNKDQVLYNIHDLQCRIPELVGKRIQGCFHGWVILSNHHYTRWFLWNPEAANSTLIRLPLLKYVGGNGRPIECYLSSPPDVPGSILLLARKDKPKFVFCRLDRERKSPLRWITMSYAQQLSSITGRNGILQSLTYCNGDLYAAFFSQCVVKIHIVVKEKSVMIRLFPFVMLPSPFILSGRSICSYRFLIGSSLELLVIYVGIADIKSRRPVHVSLHKLDTSRMRWVEKEDLKDTVLYMELVDDGFSHAAVSEFGGYVHFLHEMSKVVYSYNVKDKTISMSFSMRHLDLTPSYDPEFRLESDVSKADGKCKAKEDAMVVKEVVQEEEVETDDVVNLPFDVLEMIMEFCVGVEYLNFRATCKSCHLRAPLINTKVPQRRLKTYSLVSSPWLMVFDKRGGIFTFTDPMFGDNYFIRAQIVSNSKVAYSGYGWLLLLTGDSRLAFFNPFTSEVRELPAQMANCRRFCFSAPPTSPDCMVVGFSFSHVFFHFVAGAPIRRPLVLGMLLGVRFDCPTFCGRDVYALHKQLEVGVFREVGQGYRWEVVVEQLPTTGWSAVEYFLTTCNRHLLLLMVGDLGEGVEVFKLTKELEWEKTDGLGRHVIYVCEALSTCLCMAAKTPEMENKIFFSRSHSENGKVMFYSMETRMFHTFDGRNVGQETSLEDFYQHTYNHGWIEPTWC